MNKVTSKTFKKISFKADKFKECTDEFTNPNRGWYQIHSFDLGEPVSMVDREYTLNNNDSLALVLIDIGKYRDRPLDETAIEGLNTIFEFFRDYRLDMIVRVVYDTVGNCLETEPSTEEQIIEHMSQLVPVIEQYKDCIFVYQGLLIGNWGEMHSSKFLSPSRLRRLSDGLIEEINDTTYLAVRRPAYVRIMFPEGEDIRQKKVGIFDDAILASPTHLGTFGEKPANEVRREQSWKPEEEIEYVSALCDRVPYGGEALWTDEKDSLSKARNSLKEMAAYMSRLHVTYLNRIHDRAFIEHLKDLSWNGSGIYRGMNGYSYMSRHLGYRLVVRDVKCKPVESDDSMLRWDITIENVGFARAFFKSGCMMEACNEYGDVVELDISNWIELNQVPAGGSHTFIVMTPMVSGAVTLRFTKAATRQAVYFANKKKKESPIDSGVYLGTIIIE